MRLDWLEYTLPRNETPLTAAPLALGSVWVERHGSNGYRRGWVGARGGVVMSDGAESMGTHVVMSGAVLDYIESTGATLSGIIRWVHQRDGVFTRLDVACDWHTPEITPGVLYMNERLGYLTHSSKGQGTATEDRKTGGTTVTWGRRGRRSFVRCYDKLAEQGLTPDGTPGVPDWWTRVEWEFRQPTSDRLARAWEVGDEGAVRRALTTTLAWRDAENWRDPQRMSKAPLHGAWVALMGGEPGPRQAQAKRPPTAWEDCERYLQEQVAPLLAAYVDGHPDPAGAIGKLLDGGRERRADRHRLVIASGPFGHPDGASTRPDGEWLG